MADGGSTLQQLSWNSATCTVKGQGCEFSKDVQFTFDLPIEFKAVDLSVTSAFTAAVKGEARQQQDVLKTTIAAPSSDLVLAGETRVKLRSLATYVQDNTTQTALPDDNSNINTGYRINRVFVGDALDVATVPASSEQVGTSWKLKVEIELHSKPDDHHHERPRHDPAARVHCGSCRLSVWHLAASIWPTRGLGSVDQEEEVLSAGGYGSKGIGSADTSG